ncbi:ABC-type transporter, integral membrane subunit [Actinobacteria bacterium OK074]|nr:ABC-type transporter, integral membrane subunit [Actinobacteria bacterium OK074]
MSAGSVPLTSAPAPAPAPVRRWPGIGRRAAVRLGHSVLVLWGAITLTFVALHLTRGSVVDSIIGNNTQVTPRIREQIVQEYGLGRPVWQQYLSYLGRLLHGDLGMSYQLQTPVADALGSQLPSTLALMSTATVLAVVLTLLLALLTAGRGRWLRGPVSFLEVVGVAVPQFWLGILLLTVFSFGLHWFSVVGGGLSGLVLPAVTLALPLVGVLSQVLREGLERALDEPFAVTARARGARAAAIVLRHALRHALAPVVTLLGLMVGAMTGGAVIVEQVYSRPGVGQLLLTAVTGKDIPVVLGVVLVTAAFYVVVNLLVDVLYPIVDPRLRD